jgi:stage II sporulation protein M
LTEKPRRGDSPRILWTLFKDNAEYVWRLRPLFLICLILFFFSTVASFYLGDTISDELPEEFQGLLQFIEDLSLPFLFLFIVFNNIINSFVWMVLGVALGVPPLYFIVRNGFLIGRVIYSTSLEAGLPLTVALLIPHGIIEIPSILLSSAAGMSLGYQLINRFRGMGSLRAELGRALNLFIWKIAPLLFIAAVVEVLLIGAFI